MAISRYPIVTICGSMRYHEAMLIVAGKLTAARYIVLMPFVAIDPEKQTGNPTKEMLDDMHRAKIDLSDCGIVVVGAHIGESTRGEIEYAKSNGKPVRYWSNLFGAIE